MNRFLALLSSMLLAASCNFIPLYDLSGNVQINLDFQLEQQVDIPQGFLTRDSVNLSKKALGSLPQTMQVKFFEPETHRLVKDQFLSSAGGQVNIPAGTYDILIYSLGSEYSQIWGVESRSGIYAFTNTAGTLNYNTDSWSSIKEPDHVYTAKLENVEVPSFESASGHIAYVINADASSILDTYTFEMTNVDGIDNIDECALYITAQEGRSFLWGNREGETLSALKFTAYPDRDNHRIFSVFNTFGRFKDSREKVWVILYVRNLAGDQFMARFDLTDQFDDPDNTGHNLKITDKVTIPEGSSQGGFDPSVIGWDDPIIITN